MKWIFRFLTIGSLCAALAVPFFIKDGTGSSMWSLPFINSQNAPTLLKVDQLPEKEVVRDVYKWQDQNGVWQYSDVPPPEGIQTSKLQVSNKTNVIQSFKPPQPDTPETVAATPEISKEAQATLDEAKDEDLLSFERASNIVNEAKAVAELMNARNQQLQQISGGGDNK